MNNPKKSHAAKLRALRAKYFVAKADEEMKRLQVQKPITQADLDSLLHTHLRTGRYDKG